MKVIIGPTCSGKSTYIQKIKQKNRAINVLYGFNISDQSKFTANDVVHYNLLHYHTCSSLSKFERSFLDEPIFKKIFSDINAIKDLVVIVSPRVDLISRATNRTKVEKEINSRYNSDFWIQAIKETNFYYLYYV